MSDLNRLADLLLPGIRSAQLKLEEVSNYLSVMPNSLRQYNGWQPIETAPEDGKPYEPKLAPAQYWEAQADMLRQNYKEAADEIERLRERLHNPTPEMIAAAWGAWHERHGGKLGFGPAFVEAMKAMAHAALKEGE